MSNIDDTNDWLEMQVRKHVREELANGCRCNSTNGTRKQEELRAAPVFNITQRGVISDTNREHLEKINELVAGLECEVARAINESSFVTVSENTGVGAVPPSAPTHPRFVPVGEYVYDRARSWVVAAVSRSAAISIADELNEQPNNVINFEWENVK